MSKKSESNLKNKFFSLLGSQRSGSSSRSFSEEFYLNEEILKGLNKQCSIQSRLKILRDLSEDIGEKRLEQSSIASLWKETQDILKAGHEEARHSVIGFFVVLVENQYQQLGTMRREIFQFLVSRQGSEDMQNYFDLLKSLTNNGEDIAMFEEDIGLYILTVLPSMVEKGRTLDVLSFMSNMTTKNATYVDGGVISGIIRNCCVYSRPQCAKEVEYCIKYIETAVQYAIVPYSCITNILLYICTARVGVSVKSPLSALIDNVAKMIISCKLGYTAIYTLCSFLEKAPVNTSYPPQDIQKSVIYLLSKTLWNSSRTHPEKHYCSAVMPSIFKAVKKEEEEVVMETIECLKYYIKHHGDIIEQTAWDMILDILQEIVRQQKPARFKLAGCLNELIDEIEQLYKKKNRMLIGADKLYFDIIENCIDIRSGESVTSLMSFKESLIVPGTINWLNNLLLFMEDFYHNKKRPEIIRLKSLDKFWDVVGHFYKLYEEELLDRVVLEVFKQLPQENSGKIRNRAVTFIIQLCTWCTTCKFFDMATILFKLLGNVIEKNQSEAFSICENLIDLFTTKIGRTPSKHSLFLFERLCAFGMWLYSDNTTSRSIFSKTAQIRKSVMDCLPRISISVSGETIMYSSKEVIRCPFLEVNHSRDAELNERFDEVVKMEQPIQQFAIHKLPYHFVDELIHRCLEKENDWSVLIMTLSSIKKRLCNRQLIERECSNFKSITKQLISIVTQLSNVKEASERISSIQNIPQDKKLSDLKAYIFPVLVRMIPHQTEYMKNTGDYVIARNIINTMVNHGLMTTLPFAKTCIEGLTLALLEFPTLLIRPLHDIVLRISKITAGRTLALSTLTFLSALAHSPELYKDFTEEEYKTIIGVMLPYTDPVKFEVYTIHFAHVVVCDWYVRCHYQFRPSFKNFILGKLRATVLSVDPSITHSQISEHRLDKRKASVEVRHIRPKSGEFHKSTGSGSSTPRGSMKSVTSMESSRGPDQETIVAHNRLIDVTEDLLERCMFAGRCNIIKKSVHIDVLFKSKITKTWVVGNTLITISTSKSCEESSENECQRCRMVQVILGERSLDSSSPENSNEFGTVESGSSQGKRLNKILTPSCNCWCKDWAFLEVRSPTGNSSIVLRIQNKCHVVQFDSLVGGDCHVLTSVFDDDLTQLLTRDVQTDYSPQFLGSLVDKDSSSDGSRKIKFRRRRLSTPETEEMTPTTSIDSRPRSQSDVGIKPEFYEFVNTENNKVKEANTMYKPKDEDTLTKDDIKTITEDEENSTMRMLRQKDFKYAKNRQDNANEGYIETRRLSYKPQKQSPPSLRRASDKSSSTSRSGSSHDIMSMRSRDLPSKGQCHMDVDPEYVFRQLYPLIPFTPESSPTLLPDSEDLNRALSNLDLILVFNTHKIGVIYVGPGQAKEVNILRNTYGSVRYVEFLNKLGDMIWLHDIDQRTVYVGGLDTKGADGDYAISWRDKTTQVVFHVATLMPQQDTDPTSTNKKRHIGNNFVTIVYNDSGYPYQTGIIKGECNFCDVVIEPQSNDMNLITFKNTQNTTTPLTDLKPHGALLVNDAPLASLVRQLAVNANSLCQVMRGTSRGAAYSCNWIERLKKIQTIKSRNLTPASSPTPSRRETMY